jgi:nucleoside phosphorylase
VTLLLACALRPEQWALRAGLRTDGASAGTPPTLLRTGMGGVRAGRAVARALEAGPDSSAMLYAGFGAAVTPALRPGDVLLASSVHGEDGSVHPTADTAGLAEKLRALGIAVHSGPLFSADKLVHGARREELRRAGFLGVEMETAGAFRGLATTRPGIPVAAVRVVVDTPEHELIRPATLVHGIHAWRVLRAVAPLLADWRADSASTPAPAPITL